MSNAGLFTSYALILISLLMIIGLMALLNSISKNRNPEQIRAKHERVPLLSPRIYLFLVRHGILGSGPLSKAFVRALTFLNEHIANKDYKYSIPWYLILGPSLSGKSSILASLSDLHLPEQNVNQSNFNGCEWFMFMNGIVMEVKDTIFSIENTQDVVNKDWQLLAMLLAYFRPRKPLDGIIITLPIDLLKREDKFAAEKKIMAQNMFDNLFWMQNTLNMRLPVYVVLTKCDLLEGFTNICLNMSGEEKEQIFGWSSVYSADTAYSSSWVDEAIEYIGVGLNKTVLKAAANAAVPETIEDSLYVATDLESIKSSLKTFTNSIFSPNRSGVELILRGIYLTGSDFEDSGSRSKSAVALNPEFISSVGQKSTLVNFVRDLFCEKIFLEKNVAQPIVDNYVFHGKRVITKRAIMCMFSLFLVIGFYFSNKHITQKAAEFSLTLSEIDSTLYQLKNNADSDSLKNKTKQLLDYIFKLDPSQLYSFFIPISWFSDIRRNITGVASDAFDKAVVSSMYSELEKRANSVTETLSVVLSNKIVLSPTELEEFKKLKKYVQQVLDLENTGASYNKILLEDDEGAVESLAKFLYADDLNRKNILKQKLKKDRGKFKEFDLSKHKAEIVKNIVTLEKAFIEHCFSDVVEKIFINLSASIENLLKDVEDVNKQLHLNEVVDLYKKMDTVVKFLKSDVLNWWDSESFNPGKEYQELLDQMKKSSLIDDKFIKSFKNYADAAFLDFKYRLSNISSTITGHLISRGRYIVVSEPSQGFMRFYGDIQKILKQKFVINVDEQDIILDVPDDKLLLWNGGLMQQATRLIKAYQDFTATALKDFNINMQPFYKTLTRKLLYNSVKSLVAKSQILEDNSQNVSLTMEETAIKRACDDLRSVFSDLLSVAGFFRDEFPSNFGQTEGFMKMIFSNYVRVLNTIDVMFKLSEPFGVRSEMFYDWDGKRNPSFVGFSVSDQEELNEYLTSQISRVEFLAKTLSEPVVNLLRTKYFNFEVNGVVVQKWVDLIAAMDEYKAKTPGNSISILEGFIKKTLGELSLDVIANENKLDMFLDSRKDYFLNKRAIIAHYLKYRAQELIYVNSLVLYNNVAKYFNEHIAGFFPFVNGYSNVYPDCAADQLTKFIAQFKTIGEPAKKALQMISEANPDAREALAFIARIESIMPFLEGWIQNYSRKSAVESAIAFKIEFRAEKANEVGGDQIIDWRMKVGDAFVTIEDQDKMMGWNIGQEIKTIYQWASDSNELPHADTKGLVDVLGQNAIFRYIGNWALIRMIRSHQVMEESYPGAGLVMMFSIPTVHKDTFKPFRQAKLFCRIKFFEKNKDTWSAVAIPTFPHTAPVINMRMSNDVNKSTN